jgi:hypothetical protein
VASRKALNLLHWEICAVLHRHTATAIKTASKFGAYFIVVLLFAVTLMAAGAMQSQYLPIGGVQWLPV